ncbi:MAG: hypothetical protein KTR25_18605 [Myxococcales bacterium]|nr:hypothetical protein [Myxococcales bacterium]
MPDPDLFKKAGMLIHAEEKAQDKRLEAYALGTLTPEQVQALLEEADGDKALAQQLELYRPLSPAIRKSLRTVAHRSMTPVVGPWTIVRVSSALATAAALMVSLWSRPSPQFPEYQIEVRAQASEWRGKEPEALTTVELETPLEIVLRPSVAVAAHVDARMWTVTPLGTHTTTTRPQVSAQGAIRWMAPAKDFSDGEMGRIELIVVVGASGRLPRKMPQAPPIHTQWRLLRFQIHIYDRETSM